MTTKTPDVRLFHALERMVSSRSYHACLEPNDDGTTSVTFDFPQFKEPETGRMQDMRLYWRINLDDEKASFVQAPAVEKQYKTRRYHLYDVLNERQLFNLSVMFRLAELDRRRELAEAKQYREQRLENAAVILDQLGL